LGASAAALGLTPLEARAAADAHPDSRRTLRRVAFGSCCEQSKEQPIWDVINELEPDLFLFIGDNIYGDTRDMAVLRAKYAQLGAKPGFRRLRERTPILAVWDDHDFGEDDAGGDYPMKEESRRIFCDFWGETADSPRRTRDGIYASYVFGESGSRVQVVLPDLRFNRTPILKRDLAGTKYEDWAKSLEAAGRPVPGPYEREPDRRATMLGETQWRWLEEQLHAPAQVRLFASSLQVLADFAGWEGWINYAGDHERLIDTIRRTRASGLVFLSGDTHYGELSRLDANVPYTFWDLTSSGLTETWHVMPPNALRVGEVVREPNFGLVEIDWTAPLPKLALQVRDGAGRVRIEQRVDTARLRIA
jgi:alkaline phosphatase D